MSERRSLRLLIVDEHREYFEQIRDCADMCRHMFDIQCEFSATGKEAVKRVGSWLPSVVLVNAHIPDMNSFELVDSCREACASVIVASDHMSSEISETAREHGASGYISKSEDPEDIEALLTQIVMLSPDAPVQH